MSNPTHEPLKKEMHEAEREIDAIENKIANADDSDTYPADYAAMRSEQEAQRQHALKCKASIDDQVMAEHGNSQEHTRKDTPPESDPTKIDRNATAGTKNSLGAQSVRDVRPSTGDSVVEAMDEKPLR